MEVRLRKTSRKITVSNINHARKAAKNAINLYNEIRLHLSLDYKTPNMVYKLSA
ncbi:integrase core domain-containing protein [Winogradskyella undariae]|uniref:integrase core domain-containing protein n=1 Tax=Winogradskyella undariae TaxID=1285465 RepID=UPI0015CB081B